MTRVAVVAAIFATLPVLGAHGASGSGLFGVVTRGPTTPVCAVEQPCTRPAAGALLVFSRGGSTVRVTVRADGSYRVRLAPGLYAARTSSGRLEPASVRVRAGTTRRVDFSIDTGIR
jgi:hypothetical protein